MGFLDDITARFKSLIADEEDAAAEDQQLQKAIATLLARSLVIDGEETIEEAMKLVDLLKSQFELSDREAEDLFKEAKEAERDATDLFKFTNVVTEKMDRDGRISVLEMMFEIVAADGKVDVFEENLMNRASNLLRVPDYYRDEVRSKLFALMSK
ncbi:TerB family tellurite resistance protein [Pyruvatibacter sp.]|uniref:tellurite resistance TerB family protein n=1 Tax=Pyruvatibacter sp. TaxID=1981328 RepID=UPI0029697E21|nr:TerB family tellurite resistance protein [Alphaproteobacteria bacterium]